MYIDMTRSKKKVVYINGGTSSKWQNEKFEIL